MFEKVGWAFVKFFPCYEIITVADEMEFYTLLNHEQNIYDPPYGNHHGDGKLSHTKGAKLSYYINLGYTLSITFSMLVGEWYISDSPVNTPHGYLMFVPWFVFMNCNGADESN